MHRHTRAYCRHQRTRWIARRRRQFSHRLGPIDWAAGRHPNGEGRYPLNAPRPREVREQEFWNPARLGRYAKGNGGRCSCRSCRRVRTRYGRLFKYCRRRALVIALAEMAEAMEVA